MKTKNKIILITLGLIIGLQTIIKVEAKTTVINNSSQQKATKVETNKSAFETEEKDSVILPIVLGVLAVPAMILVGTYYILEDAGAIK